jgi:hypothetical protein
MSFTYQSSSIIVRSFHSANRMEPLTDVLTYIDWTSTTCRVEPGSIDRVANSGTSDLLNYSITAGN